MKLTKEQLKMIGDSYLDDLPFRYEDVDQKKLWNNMPEEIQLEALRWGANDTVVRDNVFEFLLKNQLDLTADMWYDKDEDGIYTHELAEALFGKGEPIYIELDYEKLKREED
jgi:hypothetical protein